MNSLKAWFCTWAIPEFKDFDIEQKYEVYNGLIECNLSLKQVKVYALRRVDSESMQAIKCALSNGVSCRDMEICRDLDISAWRITMIVDGLLSGVSGDDIWKYCDPKLSDAEAFRIISQVMHPK